MPFLLALLLCLTQPDPPTPNADAGAWRVKVEQYAVAHLEHPAWGVAHARRDYRLSLQLAKAANLQVDDDALYAAAFLHDIGAIEGYSKQGVEHMARALELVDPILAEAGFPAEKLPLVHAIIGHHMYFSDPAGQPAEAVVFRDADTLDFLGTIGVSRIFALTGKHRWAPDIEGAEATIRKNAAELPARLTTAPARTLGAERVAEMNEFLERLKREK